MAFKEQYTTAEIQNAALAIDKDTKEKEKTVLSNDAYAIGQLLECLINKMTR